MTDGAAPTGEPLREAARLVGGIMLGAAAAALALQVVPAGAAQPTLVLLLATLGVLMAFKLGSAGHVADAAGLTAALAVPFFPVAPAPLGLVVAAVALFVTVAQRGRSPLALLAAATYFVGLRHAAGVDLLLGVAALPAVALFLGLLAYGGLVVRLGSGTSWTGPTAALLGVLLLLAAFPLLDAALVTDAGVAALVLGALMGGLLAAGLALRLRALAVTMAVLLPAAVLTFALLALGPALAALVLLALGGALVWQGESVRRWAHA